MVSACFCVDSISSLLQRKTLNIAGRQVETPHFFIMDNYTYGILKDVHRHRIGMQLHQNRIWETFYLRMVGLLLTIYNDNFYYLPITSIIFMAVDKGSFNIFLKSFIKIIFTK